MSKSLNKGQSTLEYVIILAAVVGAIVMAAGYIKGKLSDEGKGLKKLTSTAATKVGSVKFP